MRAGFGVAVAARLLANADALAAQTPLPLRRNAVAALSESERSARAFGHIVGLRELSDGRVLLIDGAGRVLVLLDAQLRTSGQIGRWGEGPNEYRNPVLLFAVGTDSSIVVDGSDRRWLLYVNDRFVALDDGLRALKSSVRGELSGLSSRVALDLVGVGSPRRIPFPGIRGRAEGHERVAILTRNANGSTDTLALGQTAFYGFARGMGKAMSHTALHPLQSSDQAAAFLDGRIAIARLQPYSVEWRSSSGQLLKKTVLDEPMPAITKAVRRSIAQSFAREADGSSVFTDTDFAMWPDRAPPFTSRSLVAGLDGRLYVQRTAMGGSSRRRIDVFSVEAGHEGAFELPAGERLFGVGKRGIYVARVNEDEEVVLVRYRPVTFVR